MKTHTHTEERVPAQRNGIAIKALAELLLLVLCARPYLANTSSVGVSRAAAPDARLHMFPYPRACVLLPGMGRF